MLSPSSSVKASISIRGRSGRGRGRGRSGVQSAFGNMTINEEQQEENSLFNLVKNGKYACQKIVDDWIEFYKSSRDVAIVELVQFFISSSGCKGKVDRNLVLTSKYPDLIRNMTEAFDEDNADYPIISSGASWRRFRQAFCDFVQMLVRQCQYSIIYDQFLMDHVISLLPVLADSQVRAFRHTGTVGAMKITTALVEVAVSLLKNMESINRQYETEKIKQRKASERAELLSQKKLEYEQNVDEIKNMLAYVFKSVFVHRYRDILPDIRSTCIVELGVWIGKYPQMFLDDTYLKYIGWTLFDKIGEVRMKCLQTLLPLYEDEHLGNKMELFTNKFKVCDYNQQHKASLIIRLSPVLFMTFYHFMGDMTMSERIVAMALDREPEAAVSAVKLITYLSKNLVDFKARSPEKRFLTISKKFLRTSYKNTKKSTGPKMHYRDVLSDKDNEFIYELVYASHRPLATAAGEYLSSRLFVPYKDPTLGRQPKNKNNKQKSPNVRLIRDLVLFHQECQLHDHAPYLVDALIDSNEMMKDWECMTDLLLDGPGIDDSALTDKQERILIDIMCCAVKQTATQEPPVGRILPKKSQKEQRQVIDDRVRLSEHFMITLPALIQKFIADPDKLLNLLQIPQYFQLDLYTSMRLEKYLEALLACLDQLFDQHIDDEVLTHCAKIYEFLCADHPSVQQRCEVAKAKKVDSLIISLSNNLRQFREDYPNVDDEDLAAVSASFKKITILNTFHDLSRWNVWDTCLDILQAQDDAAILPPEIIDKAVRCCFFTASWQLKKLLDTGYENTWKSKPNSKCCIEEEAFFHRFANWSLIVRLALKVVLKFSDIMEKCISDQCFENIHLISFCYQFFNDYGDIIKVTIVKLRDISKVKCARTLALALSNQFTSLKEDAEDGILDPQTESFASLRDLAKKFASCFGNDPVRYREALASLHK
uniref:SCD domain-containing protein n=1 Tax=Romanomermis culicivorax TaxID=13658 RepID=A0A915K3J5_ROMCU